MASQSERGHAKNVANFKELITVINGFGVQYSPISEELQTESLAKVLEKAELVIDKLKSCELAEKQATARLQTAFKGLGTLTSQLLGLVESMRADESVVENLRSLKKRITGENARRKKSTDANSEMVEEKETRSTSRQSYDSRLDDFQRFVLILQSVQGYTPKEDAFKIDTLQKKLEAMKKAITESDEYTTTRRMVMNERNTLLYTADTGLVDTAQRVRSYIKAAFGGTRSEAYKRVCKIKLASPPRLS